MGLMIILWTVFIVAASISAFFCRCFLCKEVLRKKDRTGS